MPFVSDRNKVPARAEDDTLGEDKLKPLIYKNTLSKVNFSPPLHEAEPRGYGYEIDTHFVHFFGRASGLWVISSGLTTTQGKSGALDDWLAARSAQRKLPPHCAR